MNSEESSYLLIDAINGNTSVIYSRKLKLFYTESATVGSGHTLLSTSEHFYHSLVDSLQIFCFFLVFFCGLCSFTLILMLMLFLLFTK